MDWLKAVIARLLGRPTQQVSNTASPIQPVGPAHPEPTTPTGSRSFAEATYHLPQRAPIPQSPSSEPAPRTTRARKHGNVKVIASTAAQLIQAGSKSPTPAPRSLQRVEQAAKAKQKSAKKTKAAAKPSRAKARVQTRTARPSGASGK